ncbi:MAG: sensor histidine kinase [Chromatiales bacterium]|nr:sensor histidine kinase [Chromatiales bacterium]
MAGRESSREPPEDGGDLAPAKTQAPAMEEKTSRKPPGKIANFTVDAALLRELGERLIGRPYIALAELVKNAYDADAVQCRIEFGADRIVVSDDGHGMSEKEFLEHWMRIGTTHKAEKRRSQSLGRPMTGSKGLGRLSVQFLADWMELESTSEDDPESLLYALVDWRVIRSGHDIGTVNVLWDGDEQPEVSTYPGGRGTGTRIVLKGLKSEWNTAAIDALGKEVWMLRSPFGRSSRRSDGRFAGDFHVDVDAPEIKNAERAFDKMQKALFDNWKARIHGSLHGGRFGGKAAVSVEFKPGYPEDHDEPARFGETVSLPVSEKKTVGPSTLDRAEFEILVFKTEGRQSGGLSVGDVREYLRKFGNVSVYDAGFRLPYYGSGDLGSGQDWLEIAIDQGRRLAVSELLPERLGAPVRYLLDLPAPGRIFGAVHIDTNHEHATAEKLSAGPGEWLQIQAGRDRLAPNRAFEELRDLVRFSLDFYANRFRLLADRSADTGRAKEPPSRTFDRAVATLDRNKTEIPENVYREVRREVTVAREAAVTEEQALDRRAVLLAPLATAGITALALNHELSRETLFLEGAGATLRRIAKLHRIPELDAIADDLEDARRRFLSLRELFAPLLSDEDRLATDRLAARPLISQVVRAIRPLMPGVKFDISGTLDDLRFPIGSFAEWNAVLQNVLTNAWNAMLDSAHATISIDGGRRRGRSPREWLRISDTGVGLNVPLKDSTKLFEPFERRLKISDANRSIAIGGQGLGLAIVRMIARRREAEVAFVKPRERFSTTFEISWKGAKR